MNFFNRNRFKSPIESEMLQIKKGRRFRLLIRFEMVRIKVCRNGQQNQRYEAKFVKSQEGRTLNHHSIDHASEPSTYQRTRVSKQTDRENRLQKLRTRGNYHQVETRSGYPQTNRRRTCKKSSFLQRNHQKIACEGLIIRGGA